MMSRHRRLIAALGSAVMAIAGFASVSAAPAAAASVARPAAVSVPAAPGRSGTSVHPSSSNEGAVKGVVSNGSGAPLPGVTVYVCETYPTYSCSTPVTSSTGAYSVSGLMPGTYSATATDAPLLPGSNAPFNVVSGTVTTANLVLLAVTPLPPGVSIPGTSGTPPLVHWAAFNPFFVAGLCSGGTASFVIVQNGAPIWPAGVPSPGAMSETPFGSGTYTGSIPPFSPDDHGYAEITVTVHCPGGTVQTVQFCIYLDPSGTVISPAGLPVGGATVTLLSAPSAAGPFTPVPNGSTVMSPANRVNPGVTAADGLFGWDVVPGWYEVQAQKTGCVAPTSPPSPVAVSSVLLIPPAVTGLLLTLDCTGSPATSITTPGSATFTAGQGGVAKLVATGSPDPTWTESGALPAGVNFSSAGGGTAALVVGSSAAPGTTTFTATANNGVGSPVSQTFTLTINPVNGPTFTSATSVGFTVGTGGAFQVTANGAPVPLLSAPGPLPAGVTFTPGSAGNGVLVVAASAAAGSVPITFVATAGTSSTLQSFLLTITPPAPLITSGSSAQFTLNPGGLGGTFTAVATGVPTPNLFVTGALPPGATFTSLTNGTATLAVSPGTAAGVYTFGINATNGVSPAASQTFTLTVN
jgi:large repetitive protein